MTKKVIVCSTWCLLVFSAIPACRADSAAPSAKSESPVQSSKAEQALATARANPIEGKEFDASYEVSNFIGSSTMRMLCDGHGHTRTETSNSNGKIVTITDYPQKTMYSLIDAQTLAMKMPYSPSRTHEVIDQASARAHNAQPIGSKVIAGHPCHGFEYAQDNAVNQAWIGDDIGNLVQLTVKSPQGDSQLLLQSYAAACPKTAQLTVPQEYSILQIPTTASN